MSLGIPDLSWARAWPLRLLLHKPGKLLDTGTNVSGRPPLSMSSCSWKCLAPPARPGVAQGWPCHGRLEASDAVRVRPEASRRAARPPDPERSGDDRPQVAAFSGDSTGLLPLTCVQPAVNTKNQGVSAQTCPLLPQCGMYARHRGRARQCDTVSVPQLHPQAASKDVVQAAE